MFDVGIDELIRDQGKQLLIYCGREVIQDPFEKNVKVELLNPLPIPALIIDMIASQIVWKMPGIETGNAKEIFISKKYRSLIEQSQKIGVVQDDGTTVFYEGWRDKGKLQIQERQGFLRMFIYSKHT